MSTIEHTTKANAEKLPLHRRIVELMQEKGDAFTIRSFAQRLGISREYLRLMLTGGRAIPPAYLNKIADGLGVSTERLKGMDTIKREQDLAGFFNSKSRTKPMLLRALATASDLAAIARGATKKGQALNNLGRVQYLAGQYEQAHETWMLALEYAKHLHDQFEEKQLLHLVTVNVMLSHTIRKEYSNVEDLLSLVETTFADDPEKLGIAQYTRMKVQEARGDLEKAKQHAYQSLKYIEQTPNTKQNISNIS